MENYNLAIFDPENIRKVSLDIIKKCDVPEKWIDEIFKMLDHDSLIKYLSEKCSNEEDYEMKLSHIWNIIKRFPLNEINVELLDGIKSYVIFPSEYIFYNKIGNITYEKAYILMESVENCMKKPKGVQFIEKITTRDHKLISSYSYDFIRAIKVSYESDDSIKFPLKCKVSINQWVKEIWIQDEWTNLSDNLIPNHKIFPVTLTFYCDQKPEIKALISVIALNLEERKLWLDSLIDKPIDYYSMGFRQESII